MESWTNSYIIMMLYLLIVSRELMELIPGWTLSGARGASH